MPWQELLTVVCFLWMSSSEVGANAVQTPKNIQSVSSVNSNLLSFVKNAPMAIYASAVPHGAYSFNAPVYRAPVKTATNLVPVHSENLVLHKQSGYLTDSYGNKFLDTPQSFSYKTVFPQEFVALQDLPAHLAQPFVAAPSAFNLKQALPQFSYGTPLRLPQALNTRGPAPLMYAQNASPLPLPFQANFGNLPLQNLQFTAAQQPSNQNAIFFNANSYKPFPTFNKEPEKFQRLQEKPIVVQDSQKQEEFTPTTYRPTKAPLTKLSEQFKITTVQDGKKTVVSIPTKPSLPHIEDLDLLEPLVFDNPVVPQVQHFLPKINYPPIIKAPVMQTKHKHTEFLNQITKYYDASIKPEHRGLDKSEGAYANNDDDEVTEHRQSPNNFKTETPVEKYNDESKEENNQGRGHSYDLKNDDSEDDLGNDHYEDKPKYKHVEIKDKRPIEEHKPKYFIESDSHKPRNFNEKHHEHQKNDNQENKQHNHYRHEKSKPQIHHETKYKKEERAPKQILRFTSNNPNMKIYSHYEPKQEVRQKPPPVKIIKVIQKPQSSHTGVNHNFDEKPKRIIVKEEAPIENHSLREQMLAEVFKEEENNEEDFEKAYKNAAFGFPAYNKDTKVEKDVYNPSSYGVPKYHEAIDFENSPFETFFHNDEEDSPKNSRLTYKEVRNHNIDDYMRNFNAKYPKEMKEFLKANKDYFQDYRGQPHYFSTIKSHKSKPDFILGNNKKNDNPKYLAKYKTKPIKYEFDYSKVGSARDNYAHATKPSSSYRNKLWTNTQFFEPQYQYGFEPIPKLLDSELSAMASNDSPESETPGSRKKIYKENWYLHKTRTGGKS